MQNTQSQYHSIYEPAHSLQSACVDPLSHALSIRIFFNAREHEHDAPHLHVFLSSHSRAESRHPCRLCRQPHLAEPCIHGHRVQTVLLICIQVRRLQSMEAVLRRKYRSCQMEEAQLVECRPAAMGFPLRQTRVWPMMRLVQRRQAL